MKRLTTIGLVITALWAGAFVLILTLNLESARDLGLNEWGDFLSGATAPLALFWLVIGYFLQGEELRLNTAALRAQEEQLRKQVAETAALAMNSERQAMAAEQLALASKGESERAVVAERTNAQPLLGSGGGRKTESTIYTAIVNSGATISQIAVGTDEAGIQLKLVPTGVLAAGAVTSLMAQGVTRYPYRFRISYVDRLQQKHTKQFEMTGEHEFREI